jgi:Xaa-Pro aminopeptidase
METAAETSWTGFSLAERDRRWNAVRANATRAGYDCTFVPLCCDGRNLHLSLEQVRGTRSDCRYLTQMENAAIAIPTDGRSPIVVNDRGAGNAWIDDARPVARGGMRGSWTNAMVEALLELGMERARIGVVGLGRGKVTHGRAVSGVVNHSAYAGVQRRLPDATFEDGTDVVGFARYVKSDEEIAALRRGASIAAEGIAEMSRVARPGVPEAALYAKVMRRMLELGSEYYPLAINCGPIDAVNYRHEDPQLGRTLAPMWLIENETDAIWGGMVAQEMQPILLGPIPEVYKPVIELQRELYYAGLDYMTPGREFGDMIDFVNGYGVRRGMKTSILMHGRGFGDDGPLLTPTDRGDSSRDVRVEKNNVWVWKPTATSADGKTSFSWGGCVLVTEHGGEPLAKREPGMISVV